MLLIFSSLEIENKKLVILSYWRKAERLKVCVGYWDTSQLHNLGLSHGAILAPLEGLIIADVKARTCWETTPSEGERWLDGQSELKIKRIEDRKSVV